MTAGPATAAGGMPAPVPARPRALFVTPVSPFAADSGAAQRSQHILAGLQSDFDVDVLILHEAAVMKVVALSPPPGIGCLVQVALPASRWPWHRFRPQPAATAAIEAALAGPLARYALVLGRYVWPVCQLALPAGVPVLADLDDWRFHFAPDAPRSRAALRLRLGKALAHALARRQLPRFAAAFAVLARDAAELAPLLPVTLLPNIPPPPPAAVTPVPDSGCVLFVGSLWYGPNADAIDGFLRQVWPSLREACPAARLLLAGAAPAAQRLAWSRHAGVSAPGFVDDLAAAYRQATVVIAPQSSGGGSSIKVLEAMGHGRPCVVSRLVAAAYADRFAHGREFLVAPDASTLQAQLLAALREPQGLQAMADRARAAVLDEFGLAALQTRVRQAAARTRRPAGAAP